MVEGEADSPAVRQMRSKSERSIRWVEGLVGMLGRKEGGLENGFSHL